MIQAKKNFIITSSGRDEYPSNGLYAGEVPTYFLESFGLPMDTLKEGDEVEIVVRVVSRIARVREPDATG